MERPELTLSPWEAPWRLASDEILVLHRRLEVDEAELARLGASLDRSEQARAARYLPPDARRRSVVSRGTLRQVLGGLLSREPAAIGLSEGEHGKPMLSPASTLCFNVSHAADHLYLAFARARELGVDIEGGPRELAVDSLAAAVFTLGERSELSAYSAGARRAAFLRGWTRKEAYLKARAVGLSLPLRDFSVSLAAGCAGSLSSVVNPTEAARYALSALPAPVGFAAALAWERTGEAVRRIRMFELDRGVLDDSESPPSR